MASSEKTSRLGLNLWQETDRPERADFIADNEIIEESLTGHLRDYVKHLSETEKNWVGFPYQLITYVGNGKAERTYTLDINGRAAFIFAIDRPLTEDGVTADGAPMKSIYYGVQTGIYHTPGLSVSAKKLTCNYQMESEAVAAGQSYRVRLNDYNQRYAGIVLA